MYGLISSLESKQDINENQYESFGMVYTSLPIAKQFSKRRYKYKFYFKNKEYSGSSVAYISEHIIMGSFYKVEFSDENPEHSRILFDLEYLQKLKFDNFGNVTDTIYVTKHQELKNQINDSIEKYEFEIN